jgi:hypothetical protein
MQSEVKLSNALAINLTLLLSHRPQIMQDARCEGTGAHLSDKWFTNHGQAIGTTFTIGSFCVALLANWTTIQEHQNVIAWWPVIIIPAAIYIAFRIGRSSQQVPDPSPVTAPAVAQPPPPSAREATTVASPPEEQRKKFRIDNDDLVVDRKTVKLGDYWQIREGISRLKITPIAFRDSNGEPLYVELRMDTGGSVFYGGDNAIEDSGVNRIALRQTSSGFQAEENCAYQYSFSDEHVHFIAVRVDHINKHANEVALEVCALSIHKTIKF